MIIYTVTLHVFCLFLEVLGAFTQLFSFSVLSLFFDVICCSPNTILVDGVEVCNEDTVVIKDGSEIISGPDREGQCHSFFYTYARVTIPFADYKQWISCGILLYFLDSLSIFIK